MATNCVKNGKVKDGKRSQQAYEAAQQKLEAKTNQVIQNCVQGDISARAAQAELCKQYDDPDKLQAAINKLEAARGSSIVAGKVNVSRPPTGGRIMSYIDSKDHIVAFMITPHGNTIPMVPNPAYDHVVIGGQVMFSIGSDEPLYDSAQKAANAKVGKEGDTNFLTKGNCGEGNAPVPTWVPDPNSRL